MTAGDREPNRQRYDDLPMSQRDTGAGVRKDLLSLPTRDGAFVDAALYRPQSVTPATGLVFIHPQVSFLHHYAAPHLARRGYAVAGINSRYLGNESGGILENVVLDLAAGVDWLRANGCRHVVAVGNSGGGAIACMLQRHAEKREPSTTASAGAPDLGALALTPADAIILLNAHRGRAQVFTSWLDPSVVDEQDLEATDPALDMYDPRNGPPYDAAWLATYRTAQIARNRRITRWVQERLARLTPPIADHPFVVFRTAADPRFLDSTIDPSDRAPGTYWGDARAANYMLGGLGRISGLRSWLSQWGYDTSRGNAVEHLRHTRAPLLVLQSTADQGVFPAEATALFEAATTDDKRLEWLPGATHFFRDQPEHLEHMISVVAAWLSDRAF